MSITNPKTSPWETPQRRSSSYVPIQSRLRTDPSDTLRQAHGWLTFLIQRRY